MADARERGIREGRIKMHQYWSKLTNNKDYREWQGQGWWERFITAEETNEIQDMLNERCTQKQEDQDKLRWGVIS